MMASKAPLSRLTNPLEDAGGPKVAKIKTIMPDSAIAAGRTGQ
jgi:hypothetical protein